MDDEKDLLYRIVMVLDTIVSAANNEEIIEKEPTHYLPLIFDHARGLLEEFKEKHLTNKN